MASISKPSDGGSGVVQPAPLAWAPSSGLATQTGGRCFCLLPLPTWGPALPTLGPPHSLIRHLLGLAQLFLQVRDFQPQFLQER